MRNGTIGISARVGEKKELALKTSIHIPIDRRKKKGLQRYAHKNINSVSSGWAKFTFPLFIYQYFSNFL